MLVIPALTAIFVFVCLRPHEVFESLRPVTFNAMAALVFFAYVLDVRLRVSRPRLDPLIKAGLCFFGFSVLSALIKAPAKLGVLLPGLLAPLTFFLFVAWGINSFRGFEIIARVLLGITLLMAAIGVHQGLQKAVCYLPSLSKGGEAGEEPDGRPCEHPEDCWENGGTPGLEYRCEKPGLFGTHSIEQRVRYRGLVQDPNELSWVIGIGLPIAFALYELRRSAARLALLIGALVLTGACTTMTQSRSGQLTFAAVLGVYMIRRFGWRGIVAGVLISSPVLLLGGRSGEAAAASTMERLEAWSEGLTMWRQNPLLGVGHGQFTEYHYITAHNSLVLTLAELGPIGFFIWTSAIYCSFKLLLQIYRGLADRPEAAVARTWAIALLASFAGSVTSMLFLSIPRHAILWLLVGLTGGLYAAVRVHDPNFELRFARRDFAAVGAIDAGFVVWLIVYLRFKGM
jgi:hypothetical protein